MSIGLILILFLIVMFIIFFIYIEPLISKQKISNDNEHGSARFSTMKEIKKYYKKERIGNIKENGVPIFFSKKLKYMWVDRETPHYVYLGSTGSGKSATAVIPFCSFTATAKKKRSVFITDPKGEIYHTTSKMFEDNGYKVLSIDFRNPELSNKINILEPIIKEYEVYKEYDKKASIEMDEVKKLNYTNKAMSSLAETNRLITSLSYMVIPINKQEKDPFWSNSARNLLEGLIAFFLEEYKVDNIPRNKITMTSIRKFQNSMMEEENLEKFTNYISKKEYGLKSKDSLTSILSSAENTFKSVVSLFSSKMAIFDDINISNVISKNNFDLDLLGTKPTALYIIVPDEDKSYYSLITIIVGLLYRELVKLANKQDNKKLPVEIDWILDEFANCPPLADIEAIVSVARSRGMRFHFFIQSFSQLNNVYGKDVAQIILDNCGLVYLKTNTQETAEAISKRLGKKTIESNSISQSMSLFNYNGNKSVSLMARDLMTPDEVKQLHYKTIIFSIIGYPILRDTIMYTKFKCYKSGEVERKINMLSDLSDTYFTVEQIKFDSDTDNDTKKGNNFITKENEYLFKEILEQDKENLKDAERIIKHELKKYNHSLSYINTENYRAFMSVLIDKHLLQKDKSMILAKLNKDRYHVEMKKEDDKTILEVHNVF